jgi:hypothetical protein
MISAAVVEKNYRIKQNYLSIIDIRQMSANRGFMKGPGVSVVFEIL